jgi:hypothetical protein
MPDSDDEIGPIMNGHARGAMNWHAHGEKPAVHKYPTRVAMNDPLPLASFTKNRCLYSRTHLQYSKDAGLLARRRNTKRTIETGDQKWKHVALVMDRLFFWLFVGTILISTMVVFKQKISQALGDNYNDL